MLYLPHRRFGNMLPTLFFLEKESVLPNIWCCWLSRCYLDPMSLSSRGYSVVHMRWWRTLLTDLTQPLDIIYDSFDNKSTKYRIRRAEQILRDNPSWKIETPSAHLPEYDEIITDFYARKRIEAITTDILRKSRTRPYWASSRVLFSGEVILLRTYVCDGCAGIVRALHSVTVDISEHIKQDIGHLSRMLRWLDIQYFKSEGYRIYDWGGVSKYGELTGIDSFKRSFGGKPAVIYDALICKKPLAPVLRALWRLRFGRYPDVERYIPDDERAS